MDQSLDDLMMPARFGSLTMLSAKALRIYADRELQHREGTDFPAILAPDDEVCTWIEESGHTQVGPPREIWPNAPDGPDRLSRTISWPYAR